MSNELVTIEPKKIPDVFVAGGLDPYIESIRSHVITIVPDISTEKGRKDIASMAYKIARSKTYLDNVGKDYVASLKELPKVVDAERKRMRDILEALQEEVRMPLTDWENKEKERVERHESNIQWMTDMASLVGEQWDSMDIEKMKHYLETLQNKEINDSWDEYKTRAEEVKAQTITVLVSLIAKRVKHDSEQAELSRLRAEEEQRKKIEHEQRIAKEAAERARREAEEAAQRRAAEIEAKAKAEIRAAEERVKQAEREKREAIEAERREAARVMREAEEKAKREAEAEQRRQANKNHREKINAEAVHFIEGIHGITNEQATAIVNAVANNEVPHITIRY